MKKIIIASSILLIVALIIMGVFMMPNNVTDALSQTSFVWKVSYTTVEGQKVQQWDLFLQSDLSTPIHTIIDPTAFFDMPVMVEKMKEIDENYLLTFDLPKFTIFAQNQEASADANGEYNYLEYASDDYLIFKTNDGTVLGTASGLTWYYNNNPESAIGTDIRVESLEHAIGWYNVTASFNETITVDGKKYVVKRESGNTIRFQVKEPKPLVDNTQTQINQYNSIIYYGTTPKDVVIYLNGIQATYQYSENNTYAQNDILPVGDVVLLYHVVPNNVNYSTIEDVPIQVTIAPTEIRFMVTKVFVMQQDVKKGEFEIPVTIGYGSLIGDDTLEDITFTWYTIIDGKEVALTDLTFGSYAIFAHINSDNYNTAFIDSEKNPLSGNIGGIFVVYNSTISSMNVPAVFKDVVFDSTGLISSNLDYEVELDLKDQGDNKKYRYDYYNLGLYELSIVQNNQAIVPESSFKLSFKIDDENSEYIVLHLSDGDKVVQKDSKGYFVLSESHFEDGQVSFTVLGEQRYWYWYDTFMVVIGALSFIALIGGIVTYQILRRKK